MHDGFKVDLDEATKAANGSLPKAIAMLREPVNTMLTPENFTRPGKFDAADRIVLAYEGWAQANGRRLGYGCDVMDDSAAALREIIAIYRRVDGRI